MKVSNSLSILLILVAASLSLFYFKGDIDANVTDTELSTYFAQWKTEFNKHYQTQFQHLYRFNIFKNNLLNIYEHNIQNDNSYQKGVNQFTDLTEQEFAAKHLTLIPKTSQSLQIEQIQQQETTISEDEEVNWVEKGYVTSVKDEGQCGACWAFAAIGPMEAMVKQQGKPLVSLSAQQLMDCSTSYGNQGCSGGFMENGYQYIKAKGLTTEENYPYKGIYQKCIVDGGDYKINGYTAIKDCKSLGAALLKIPIAVAVDASKFYNYKSGVFNDCSSKPMLNHALALVGMTSEYWLGKQQFGVKWGDNGYIKIAKTGSACGVCLLASFPV